MENIVPPNVSVDYIAHQISGDIAGNVRQVLAIARQIHMTEPGVVPLIPYFSFLNYLDDHSPKERMMGVDGDKALIYRAADRIRIFGPKISTGIKFESLYFRDLNKPIILQNPAIASDLELVLGTYPFKVIPFTLEQKYLDEVDAISKHLRYKIV